MFFYVVVNSQSKQAWGWKEQWEDGTVWPGETQGVWSKQDGWCVYSLPWHMLSLLLTLDQSSLPWMVTVLILISVHSLSIFRNYSFTCPLWIFDKDIMQLSDSLCLMILSLCFLFKMMCEKHFLYIVMVEVLAISLSQPAAEHDC